jgi:cellulose biosynthesis protein BcsQ
VRLVVNRSGAGRSVTEADLVAFLGRAPDARLPRDDSAMERAVNHGRPLGQVASASALRAAYLELARRVHEWSGAKPPTAPRKRRPALRSVIHRLRRHPLQEPPAETGECRFRVLTVTSNKGGVAKTTLATNLAVYFRALDETLPVLIVGLDDQPMLERMFCFDAEKPRENVLTAVRAGSLDGAIRLGQYGVHYVPTSEHVGDLKREIDDLFYLRRVLERTNWKGLVILDTKSDFEILTRNAITASNLSIVIVHDQASLIEARKVYDFLDRLGRPRERARVVLSLVDRRIKFHKEEEVDILGHLVSETRRRGYPLFESFVSRSPKVESLYTNPEGRAASILHGARESLVHLQMTHLARDVLKALEGDPWQEGQHQRRNLRAALRLSA